MRLGGQNMPPLYVVQQNSKLRLNNRRVQVEQETDEGIQVLAQIPIGQVSEIVLFGNVGLTTPLMDALLYESIPVIFLTRDGDYRGILSGGINPACASAAGAVPCAGKTLIQP